MWGNPPSGCFCSATALLGCTASAAFAGGLLGRYDLLVLLDGILLDVLLGTLLHVLLGVLFLLDRCLLGHFGLVTGGAPGARSAASTAFSRLSRNGKRCACHQTGDTEPCHDPLDPILTHGVASFTIEMDAAFQA